MEAIKIYLPPQILFPFWNRKRATCKYFKGVLIDYEDPLPKFARDKGESNGGLAPPSGG